MTEQFILWLIVHFVSDVMGVTGVEEEDGNQPITGPLRVPPAMRDSLARHDAFDYPLFNL